MKKPNIILLLLMVLACLAACHKDKEMDVKEAVVSNEEMTVADTQARFSWQVDFAGQFQTGVEVSQNENMADLKRVEASKQEDKFVAVVDSLAEGTTYYYRFVVWNKFGSSEQSVGNFKTQETPPTPGQDTTYFEITVSVNLPEGGTAAGGGTFAEGDTCTVIATANEGYNFVNWTENGNQVSAEAEYSFAVTGNRSLVANFTSQEYTITATAEPEEGGTVDGSGGYNNGDECALTATANEGYEFLNWTKEDGTIVSPEPVYAFTVTETAAFVAHFQAIIYTISASAYPENGGTVSGGGDDFHYGDECSLTATAASGYRFVNWTKDDVVVHGEPTYSFPVTESGEYVAHFEEIAFDLVVSAQPTVISQGSSSQLNAAASGGNGSFSYSWTPNASLNDASIHNPIASPSTTTTYTCTVTSGGQTGSGSCTVKVVCPPTDLTATVQNTNNVHLNWTAANPAESYNVYRNDTLIGQGVTNRNYDDNGLGSGTYHYRVSAVYQSVESPKSNEASATIYNSLSVTASANPVTIPDGGSSTLTATAIGGDGNYTYSWTPSTGVNNTHIQSPTATPSSTTTYTVTVESNGQTASDNVTVNVVKAPTNLTATVQNTNNVHLSWNEAIPADSYKVYRDNTMIAQGITNTNYNDNGLSSGTYHYRVSAVYQGVESPKSNEASATIYASLSVTASANPVTIPFGSSSTLTASATGGDGNYTYSWTPSTGLNNTQIQSPTATPSSTTTYTVTVGSNDQTASDAVTVNVVKAPTGLAATVNGNNVHLTWNAANPASSYKVYRDNTVIAQNITATSYNDNNLNWGTTYNYQVSTVYLGVESPKSNTAQAVIPSQAPEGAINGLFTINDNGDQVYFSKGNLQYNKTTNEWSFMEHQYDIVETQGQNVGENYANQNIVSLFGWGTSGWNNGNVYYQPWDTQDNGNYNQGDGYGPTDGTDFTYDLTGEYSLADWGVHNFINNTTGAWRTLTQSEWIYVFITRTGIRYAYAQITGTSNGTVNGMILFPDDWSTSIYNPNNYNQSGANFSSNSIPATQWSSLEAAGAVFLPAVGSRNETSVYSVGFLGYYWSASASFYNADCVNFGDGMLLIVSNWNSRKFGQSVRLVCSAP
jgi:fibronectin type 3 domain-containing protein